MLTLSEALWHGGAVVLGVVAWFSLHRLWSSFHAMLRGKA
jgi:hypothetical protein